MSHALRGIGRVGEQLLLRSPKDIAVGSITESELWYGVHRVGSPKLRQAVDAFLSAVPVAPFDSAAAREYGDLRAWLERRGRPIGVLDTLIAAHARALGMRLVTSDRKPFARVPGLTVEDWNRLEAPPSRRDVRGARQTARYQCLRCVGPLVQSDHSVSSPLVVADWPWS